MIEDHQYFEYSPRMEINTADPQRHEQVGDILDEDPSDNIMRIYVQNLNGLSWNQDGGRWPYICASMSSLQVDVAHVW